MTLSPPPWESRGQVWIASVAIVLTENRAGVTYDSCASRKVGVQRGGACPLRASGRGAERGADGGGLNDGPVRLALMR